MTITCTSRITRVTVYARGAVVTRRVELPDSLPAEPCELVLPQLSLQAEAGSLCAEVEGERQVVALRSRLVLPETARDEEGLRAELRALTQRQQSANHELSELRDRRQTLLGITPRLRRPRKDEPALDPSARARDALAANALLNELIAGLDARVRELEESSRALARDRQALELRLLQATSEAARGPSEPTREVVVRLGPGASLDALDISYVARAARWWPAYVARLSEGGSRAAWSLEAFVAQTTGEDWSDVRLALSTADLVADARLPELTSMRLGRAQPERSRGFRPPPEGLQALFAGFDQAEARRRAPAPELPNAQLARELADLRTKDWAPLADGAVAPQPSYGAYDKDDEKLEVEERAQKIAREEDWHFVGQADAPAPMSMAPRSGASFSPAGAVFGAVEGAAGAAATLAGGLVSGMRRRSAGRGPGGPPPPPEPEPPLEPGDAWLNFDALVLGEGDDPTWRGRLIVSHEPAADTFLEQARAALDGVEVPRHAQDPLAGRGRFDHRYEADGLADVPSRPGAQRVSLSSAEAPCTMRLRVVPSQDEQVYREVELTNPFEAPLLAGPVDVFLAGSLLTTSSIVKVGRGGTILLGLGVEDRVRVARNAKIEESTSGLIGKTTSIEHTVTIELVSSLGTAIPALVVDRVPTSDDDEVTVELLGSEPEATPYKQLDRDARVKGGLLWSLELAPGAKRELSFSYRISLSAKREIVGGNRRE